MLSKVTHCTGRLHGTGAFFMWGTYFCMGVHKHDVVVVIKTGAYIHGVLILCGCLLSRFYGRSIIIVRASRVFPWLGN